MSKNTKPSSKNILKTRKTGRRSPVKKKQKRAKKITLANVVSTLILAAISAFFFYKKRSVIGFIFAALALANFALPLLLPPSAELIASTYAVFVFLVAIATQPLIAIINLISPKAAKHLI